MKRIYLSLRYSFIFSLYWLGCTFGWCSSWFRLGIGVGKSKAASSGFPDQSNYLRQRPSEVIKNERWLKNWQEERLREYEKAKIR